MSDVDATYRLDQYASMAHDQARIDAYRSALAEFVTPDTSVADVGAGTGILTLLACQLGARHVWAIESNPVVRLVHDNVVANGFDGRVTVLHDRSTAVDLPEPVDVVVADLHGVLPFHGSMIPTLVDARARLLRADGQLLPTRDVVRAAPVHVPERYESLAGVLDRPPHGLDLSAGREQALDLVTKVRLERDAVAATPQEVADLDYRTVEHADLRVRLAFDDLDGREVHGLALWFESHLGEHVVLPSGPGDPRVAYGQLLLPFTTPVRGADLEGGLQVAVRAVPVEADYVWSWQVSAGEVDTRQSTFNQGLLTATDLDRRRESHVPELAGRAAVDAAIITGLDGSTSLGEVARDVTRRFPDRYRRWEDALGDVADVAARYT